MPEPAAACSRSRRSISEPAARWASISTPSRLAAALDRLLELPAAERDELRATVSAFVGREWTWDRTANGLLAAAGLDSPDRRADADPT